MVLSIISAALFVPVMVALDSRYLDFVGMHRMRSGYYYYSDRKGEIQVIRLN